MRDEFAIKTLTELVFSVNDDEDPIDVALSGCLGSVKRLIEDVMEAQRDAFCGIGSGKRGSGRRDQRNGYYERDYETCFGILRKLRIPRTRSGRFHSNLIDKFQRRQRKVNAFIRSMFLCGISQRDVAEVLGPFLGIEPSASTVSRISKSLDVEVKTFRSRRLDDDFVYLLLDGIALSVKLSPYAITKVALVALGIRADGSKELLSFRVEHSESEPCWSRFLNDLYQRGFKGNNLKLIISDGGAGLISALEYMYSDTAHQRCWVHKIRNVMDKIRHNQRRACLRGLRAIWQAETKLEAERAYREWERQWVFVAPRAVDCVRDDLDGLLNFLSCPREHWRLIRTTNVLERCFREFRRRLRPIGCQKNTSSCERMLFSICQRINLRWEKKRYRSPNVLTQAA